jgi:hypothetical protein
MCFDKSVILAVPKIDLEICPMNANGANIRFLTVGLDRGVDKGMEHFRIVIYLEDKILTLSRKVSQKKQQVSDISQIVEYNPGTLLFILQATLASFTTASTISTTHSVLLDSSLS